MVIANSFQRRSIECHEESRTSGIRKVVSSTSSRLIPSTPRWYETPRVGIHARCSTNW